MCERERAREGDGDADAEAEGEAEGEGDEYGERGEEREKAGRGNRARTIISRASCQLTERTCHIHAAASVRWNRHTCSAVHPRSDASHQAYMYTSCMYVSYGITAWCYCCKCIIQTNNLHVFWLTTAGTHIALTRQCIHNANATCLQTYRARTDLGHVIHISCSHDECWAWGHTQTTACNPWFVPSQTSVSKCISSASSRTT